MASYVALLRGINVGGRNKIKMPALRELCEELGLRGAQTLLQSGNVVFSANGSRVELETRLRDGIEEKFGFRPEILLRSEGELRRATESPILSREPFATARAEEPNRLLVMFLSSKPNGAAEQRLSAKHVGPETFAVAGKECFLHYPNGAGKSKLTNTVIERALGTVGTARNWNTVTRLIEAAERR